MTERRKRMRLSQEARWTFALWLFAWSVALTRREVSPSLHEAQARVLVNFRNDPRFDVVPMR